MAILLDTHVLIWFDAGAPKLGQRAIKAISESVTASQAFLCPMSFWEIELAVRRGRVELKTSMLLWRQSLLAMGFIELPFTGAEAIEMEELHDFHTDPGDRMIVAAARISNLTLVTADKNILAWDGNLKRMDAIK